MHMSSKRAVPAPNRRRARHSALWCIPTALAVVLAGCASNQPAGPAAKSTAAAGSTTMSMDPSMPMDHGGMHHDDGGIRLKTQSPAGDITMPSMAHAHEGMEMADSTPCDTMPTPAQQQGAVDLVNASWADAKQFQSLDVARANGYRPVTPTGEPVVHYINENYYYNTMAG